MNEDYKLYNTNSRITKEKNWKNILFEPDRRLQTTELIEMQDMFYLQLDKIYSKLYDFYAVVSGCKIYITRITPTNYEIALTDGQVYVELNNQEGYYLDVNANNFIINKTEIHYIGVDINQYVDVNNNDFKNPHTGGSSFGSKGANRHKITATSIISSLSNPFDKGFYPIGAIKPKTNSFNTIYNNTITYPDIFYYKNKKLTTYNTDISLPNFIENNLRLRLYEIAGNFIETGFNLHYLTQYNNRNLIVESGIAYIKGRRLETKRNIVFNIPINDLFKNQYYIFYINEEGVIYYEFATDDSSTKSYNNVLHLGTLVLKPININTARNDFMIIKSNKIMPSKLELINLKKENDGNNKMLSELALRSNELLLSVGININNKLNGILIDDFSTLDNSNISHPNFSCSILPSIQAISLPFNSNQFKNELLSVEIKDSTALYKTIINELNQEVLYWSTVDASESYAVKQNIRTNKITIPVIDNINSLSMRVTPNVIYKSDNKTFINYTSPNIINYVGLKEAVVIDTIYNDTSFNKSIYFEIVGFSPNEENIILRINNIILNALTLTEGQSSSLNNSYQASNAGKLGGYINLNSNNSNLFTNNNLTEYSITASSGEKTASSSIYVYDPEIYRTIRQTNTNSNFILPQPNKYSSILKGLLQTFVILNPCMLKGVDLYIDEIPNLTTEDILTCYIVTLDSNNNPTDECLAIGTLKIADLNITGNNAIGAPSRITFDMPINLNRGEYGLLINSSIENIKLSIAKAGNPNLTEGNLIVNSDLYNLGFLYKINNATSKINLNGDLTFNLIEYLPKSFNAITVFEIENEVPFNIIEIYCTVNLDLLGQFNLYVLDNNTWQLMNKGVFFFNNLISKTKIKIESKGTNKTHSIINYNNLAINLISNKLDGIWVSKNQMYDSSYNFLRFSIDVYIPPTSNFKYYYSSNLGDTWEELTTNDLISNNIVNTNVLTNRLIFEKEELGLTIINNENTERYMLMVKIEMYCTEITNSLPFFKNLIVSTTN